MNGSPPAADLMQELYLVASWVALLRALRDWLQLVFLLPSESDVGLVLLQALVGQPPLVLV